MLQGGFSYRPIYGRNFLRFGGVFPSRTSSKYEKVGKIADNSDLLM